MIIYKIPKEKNILFFILVICLDYIISNLSFLFVEKLYPNFAADNRITNLSTSLLFVAAVIVAPLVETLLI